jgi:hypothetical protein
MEQHIIPECYIDTRLVKALEPPKVRYNHQHGCSNVEKAIKRLKGDFALGIIDKDKKALKYLDECQLVCEQDGFLQLLKHRTENHYLVVIRPAMERWILNTAAVAELSLQDFDLPDDLDKLCDITKTAKGDREDPNAQNFGKLFREFRRCAPPSVAILTFWIHYLKANPYTADIDWIIQETNRLAGDI